nr:hypothetical protein [Tanacetum cinerariifolium]
MIIAGADNRPPMLDKTMYDLWKSRMELYIKNKENERIILNSVKNVPLIWPTVKENGETRKKQYEELSASKKLQADCDHKATNIVLQELPLDVYAIFNHHKVAKEIWDRITRFKPRVPDVSKEDSFESKNESWGDSDDDDDDDDQQGDDEISKSYNDKDADLNKTDDEEEDEFVHTPDDYVPTDDEHVDDEEYDRINKEKYSDVNVELKDTELEGEGKDDKEMTDAGHINADHENVNQEVAGDQVKDVDKEIVTTAPATQKTEVPLPSSYISSDYATKFLNFDNIPSVDIEIIAMMDIKVQHEDLSSQTSSLLTVPVLVILESSTAPTTTIPPPIPPFIPLPQQSTPVPTPTTTEATISTTSAPDFKTHSAIHQRLFDLENKVKTLRNVDHGSTIHATTKSEVQNVVKEYLRNSVDDTLHKDEDSMDKGVIDKSKKRKPDDANRVKGPPAGSNQGLKRKKTSKDAEPSKKAKSYVKLEYNMEECYKALNDKLDWNNPEGDRYPFDLSKPLPLVQSRNHQIVQFEINSKHAQQLGDGYTSVMPRRRWSNLDKKRSHIMVKDIDQYILEDEDSIDKGVIDKSKKRKPDDANRVKGPPVGSNQGLKRKKTSKDVEPSKKAKSYVELEYNMEECYKALNDQLDWNNPEGDRYPFDLSKPLPLVQSRNRQIFQEIPMVAAAGSRRVKIHSHMLILYRHIENMFSTREPIDTEADASLDQNDQADQTDQNDLNDQNDHPVQTDEILNDDQPEHSNHNNDKHIIDNLPDTKDVYVT